MTTDPRPLWKVMALAYDCSTAPGNTWEDRHGYAAEIRSLADWLVPEEEPEPLSLEDQIAWVTRYNLRQKLHAEADRAEAG